jgi:phosphoribosylformylglycinamidine synthase
MTPRDEFFPITPEVLKDHGITPDEYASILKWLGREPTKTELGIFSVMWSEHCSYKSSRIHLKRLPTENKLVVQGPGENAGIIDIGDGWNCCFKIESHNHPSFIEPFQGATTGVGGILRDIFTMGARPVAVMDSLRFGPLTVDNGGEERKAIVRRNHSVFEGIVGGVASYGNCFGVPNVGGETKFDPCYDGNPLVNAFALGLVRHDKIFYAKASGAGNPVIYVGSKTGRDGIHGATMASEEFAEGSEAKRPNVQVGDPFMEKLLLEACLEAMETGAIVAIQDMGAAGLTCSTCELGGHGGVGLEIELDLVPQRETGMTPYEIMLSESQERMLLVAEKGREEEVNKVFRKWGLDAVQIGVVQPRNYMVVKQHGVVVAEIPNDALTEGAPLYHRPIGEWKAPVPAAAPVALGAERDWNKALAGLLNSPNVNSKRYVYQQYDSMVQTNTMQGPGYEAGVVRIKESQRGLSMALDGNGRWSYLNPKLGAELATAESARNVACTGAMPAAATNCLNFGNPEKPEIMRQFSDAIDGIREACLALDTPITGGNVSFYNETFGEGIQPTPVLGIVGILDDVSKAVANVIPAAGLDVIMLSGEVAQSREEAEASFGSSEYASVLLGSLWGVPPAIDLAKERALQLALVELAGNRLVKAAKDVAEGGIAVTLAEMSFPSGIGSSVDVTGAWLPTEIVLFGEPATRVLLVADPANFAAINKLAGRHGLCAQKIGTTGGDAVKLAIEGRAVLSANVAALREGYESSLQAALQTKI